MKRSIENAVKGSFLRKTPFLIYHKTLKNVVNVITKPCITSCEAFFLSKDILQLCVLIVLDNMLYPTYNEVR